MKVAIYCRLSEEDKNKKSDSDDSESIQNQKSMLIQYAMDRDWQIYNIYSDDDYAGADRNRPEFKKLLEDAKQRKFNIILCKTQSRFTRELEMVEKYINGLFLEWNVRFISIVDNADTDLKGNKKSRQINGLINEWYLEDMSDNIKSVLTTKRQNGLYIGSDVLYGYLKNPKQKGHLIVDETAAKVVREIFSLYNQGYGKTAIATILNNRGIPNPIKYKSEKGIAYKRTKYKLGMYWRYSSVASMLSNPMYIGHMVQGKYGSPSYKSKKNKPIPKDKWIIVENTHEPIIDIDLWNSVQKKINNNFKILANGKIGLFAKKVKCMHCYYSMRSNVYNKDRYLRCSMKQVSKDSCIGSFISEKLLTQTVLNELNYMINNYLNKDNFEKNIILNNTDTKKEKVKAEILNYEKKISEYSKCIRDLYMDKSKEIINEKDFIDLSKEFFDNREKCEKTLKESQEELSDILKNEKLFKCKKQTLEKYINIKELTREMVENLIDYILIGKKDKATNEIPIEIHWNI